MPFLRAASVSFPSHGQVRLRVPPGPGLEKLQDPVVSGKLRRAIGALAGSEPDLVVEAQETDDGPSKRITEGAVRDGRLRELVDEEPALGEAVQELDLELLD